MYYCKNCFGEFKTAEIRNETHGLNSPPYEEMHLCPLCGSSDIHQKTERHCHCCGAKITDENQEYCSEACRIKGEKMWSEQAKKSRNLYSSDISKILRELKIYNKKNHTNYSYGQFVAIIRPDAKRGVKNG